MSPIAPASIAARTLPNSTTAAAAPVKGSVVEVGPAGAMICEVMVVGSPLAPVVGMRISEVVSEMG
jgi:hypothetical protein